MIFNWLQVRSWTHSSVIPCTNHTAWHVAGAQQTYTVAVHTYNLSVWRWRREDQELESSPSYTVSLRSTWHYCCIELSAGLNFSLLTGGDVHKIQENTGLHTAPLQGCVNRSDCWEKENSPAGGTACKLGREHQGCSFLKSSSMRAAMNVSVMQSPLSYSWSIHATPCSCSYK